MRRLLPPLVPWLLAGACARSEISEQSEVPSPPEDTLVATGEATWSVRFDEVALADGAVDCAYTRRYAATEDRSAPWTCPDCEVVLLASVSVSDADAACYRSLTGREPPQIERIGFDEGRVLRSASAYGPLLVLGERSDGGTDERRSFLGSVDAVERAGGGSAALEIEGELLLGSAPGDPWLGMSPPREYLCAWAALHPPPYQGPWAVEIGAQIPDAWLLDPCAEPVRLHDLAGRYTVVVVSASDCGPCQAMASTERAFLAETRALGIAVDAVTVLSDRLDRPFDEGSIDRLRSWYDVFGAGSPVLADRGWGYAMAASIRPEIAYPTWIVLSPAFEVLDVGQGYAGWEPMREAILDHWTRSR